VGCAGLDERTAKKLLAHPDVDVRAWCVRLLGDEPPVSSQVASRLVALAASEPDAIVRAQLACTARRLAPEPGLDLAFRLLCRDLDGDDPHLPLLLWWAVEQHAITARDHTLALFRSPEAWRSSLIRSTTLGRLVRRYALEASAAGDAACARLLALVPSDDHDARRTLLAALDEAMRGRLAGPARPAPARTAVHLADCDPTDVTLPRLAARLGNRPARDRARAVVDDHRAPEPDRLAMLDLLGELRDQRSVGLLLNMATRHDPASSPS